jgi:hypothetical protein
VDNRVPAQVQALLLEPVLEPLASAFGEYGEFAVEEFSQALAKAFAS